MKKRVLVFFMVVFILFGLAPGAAWANVTGSNSEGTVSWVFTDDGTLTFRGTGEVPGGIWSTDISKEDVKKVVIDIGITSIGGSAFGRCSSLISISIPDSVTSIGFDAFYGCSNLTSIHIPDSVTSIGSSAFNGCSSLTDITIPDNVTSIGFNTFESCSSLTSITIPDSVTSISGGAFSGCSGLTNIIIPDSVISIGYRAFYGCSSLQNVTIPNSVTSIGNYAFSGCGSLRSVIIPNSVKTIGREAFWCCSGLISITISDSVTYIENDTFSHCDSLTSVVIPDSVTSIGKSVFYGCSSLTSVTIPDSVTNIESLAFYDCHNLTDVYYKGTKEQWEQIIIDSGNTYLTNANIHFVNKSNKNQISIMLNGKPLSFSQAPYMANDTTMVPMRIIFEALGADVNYDSASQKITATKGDTVIELVLGQKTAKKNSESISLDVAAVTQNGNTMVPLRFVAESLQAQVNWDGATQTVSIALE